MAASYGTAIAVQGGKMSKQLDEKAREALAALGHTEDEIAELAEKQKAAPPEEENVVEKEESTEAEPQEEQGLIEKIRQLIKGKPEAPVASEPEEAESDKEVTPAETPEEVEAEKAGADEPEMNEEVLKAMAAAIVTPMAEALSAELEKRDAQIAELAEQVKALSVPIEEKVEARLRDVPPVVKVAASQVGATVAADTPASGNSQVKALVDSIVQAGKDTYGGAKYQA
jgi:transposase